MKREDDENQNVTKYGEFISSYFAWLNLDKQKKNADKLSDITKDDNE